MSHISAVILFILFAGSALAAGQTDEPLKTDIRKSGKDLKHHFDYNVTSDHDKGHSSVQPAVDANLAYQRGLEQESSGDIQGAMKSFFSSANAGFGPAMKKLSEIYNEGNSLIPRDYATAIKWHYKAEQAGVAFYTLIKR